VSSCDGGAGSSSGPVEGEISAALDSLAARLERAGTAVGRIAKLTLLLGDVRDYGTMQGALDAFYREHAPHLIETPPATTFAAVAALVPDGARFQVDAVAVR
jgi:enamine deaminase RidA (YjgF/YER057c/UK114 family)